MDEEIKQVHPALMEPPPEICFRNFLEYLLVTLLADIGWVRNYDIKPTLRVKDFGEVNVEIKLFAPIGQVMDQIIYLFFELRFFLSVRFIEEFRFQQLLLFE